MPRKKAEEEPEAEPEAEPEPEASEGMVKLKAPEGTAFVGAGEATYKVRRGIVEVPAELAESLVRHHGFTVVE